MFDEAIERTLWAALSAHEEVAAAARSGPNPSVPLTPEQVESLRALGYVD